MRTNNEKFIEIQNILTISDVHPADCNKILDLIIELSNEREQLKAYTNHNYDKAEQLQQENNQLKLINKEHQQINGELRQANKLLNEQYIRLYKEYEQQERIKYLERSNDRREDTILEQRQKICDLEDNWNKLKEYINKMHEYFLYTDANVIYKQSMKLDNQFPSLFNLSELNASDRILSSICKKMQELEQGSDSDE